MALSAVKKEPAKGKQAESPAAEAATAAPAGKKSSKLLFAALGLVLLAGGGGGAWWFMHKDAGHAGPKAEAEKPPVFAPLDNFTVNLQQEDGSQFAQIGLTLRMADEAAVNALKLRMPEVRDRILLMLSAKKPSELLTLEGKHKLADDIQGVVNQILAPAAVKKAAAAAAVAAKRAAAKKKNAPKSAEPAEAQEGDQEQTAEAAEEAAEAAPAAVVLPVTGVLFTSFIVQ